MIRYDLIDNRTLSVTVACDSCEVELCKDFDRDVMLPVAARDTEQEAIEAGWRRNVPIPIQRMSIKSRDKDGRPDEIGQEPGTMRGDLCPDCIKATEAA